tara:strand:+ start:826 stop:1068 length:243 start_codon:yes stop_codon:yes gene_type:complete
MEAQDLCDKLEQNGISVIDNAIFAQQLSGGLESTSLLGQLESSNPTRELIASLPQVEPDQTISEPKITSPSYTTDLPGLG